MHRQTVRRTALAVALGLSVSAALVAADVLTQLNLTVAAASEQLMSGIGSGWINYGIAAPAFKKAPAALRAELASGVVAWARAYSTTAEFKDAYAKLRQNRRPEAPAFEGTPEEEFAKERKKQTEDQAKSAEEMKQVLASMPPEQRKAMEDAMKQSAEAMKQMDTPEMRKMMVDGIRMAREAKKQEYAQALAKWQEEYPESPAPLIARRLRAFLDVSRDVDFDAQLSQRDGKMRFVNGAYESKPSEWKLCYRLGKEGTSAARAAAEAWLKELGH